MFSSDFSDEIANLTLAEKPNALYKSSRGWMSRYDTTSTDSEEVDSDSGYSSPLHRRKQASSGTHPVVPPAAAGGGAGFPLGGGGFPLHQHHQQQILPLNASSASAAITAHHSVASASSGVAPLNAPSSLYAAYLQHNHSGLAHAHGKLSARAPPTGNPQPGNSPSSSSACYTKQPYPSPLAAGGVPTGGKGKSTGGGMLHTTTGGPSTAADENYSNSYGIPANSTLSTTNNVVTKVTSSVTKQSGVTTKPQTQTQTLTQTQLAKNVITSKSEPEQVTEPVAAGRKRRRRRSRRKKRDMDDDAGALSDEPFELARAHSSSNVSRCSTDVNVDSQLLQFEDEAEFPDLRVASSREAEQHLFPGVVLGGDSPGGGRQGVTPTAFLSYSDILKKQTVSNQSTRSHKVHSVTSVKQHCLVWL